jgi:CheY-like chemotaxis protein
MTDHKEAEPERLVPAAASELNNLLQIVAGTVSMLENIWEGTPDSEKYFEMLRKSVDRAAKVTEQLVRRVGGEEHKIILHPALQRHAGSAPRTPVNLRVSRSILVIDDEPMALELCKQVLSQSGFTIVTANSGPEGLNVFARTPQRFDLVLLDLSMPFMDGEETFHRLRKLNPEILVLLNTGFIDKGRLERMLAEGLAGFLRRPYRPDEVVSQIQSILAAARKRRGKGTVAVPTFTPDS